MKNVGKRSVSNKKAELEGIELGFMLFIIFLAFILGWMVGGMNTSARDKFSPKDRITLDDMYFTNDTFCIYYPTITINDVAGTKSMDPLLDNNTHTIQYKPTKLEEIQVGDIVSYWNGDNLLIHRIVEIKGNYFKAKGDNNKMSDGWIIFNNIEGVVIGIIY